LRVEKSSPERVAPECRYFGACGGCQYQHMDYATQLRVKHKQISDLFERVGKISPEKIQPVIPCPAPYGYRNRIMIRSQWNGPAKKLEIGFIRADNKFVEDIAECKIAEPALNEQIKEVRANPPPKGGIKIVLRVQPENWDVPDSSFFQNNFFLLPKLVATVRGFLKAGGARHLIDLYCGVGFFGIELADLVASFVGVEYDQLAIKAARKNAEQDDFCVRLARANLLHDGVHAGENVSFGVVVLVGIVGADHHDGHLGLDAVELALFKTPEDVLRAVAADAHVDDLALAVKFRPHV